MKFTAANGVDDWIVDSVNQEELACNAANLVSQIALISHFGTDPTVKEDTGHGQSEDTKGCDST